MNLESRYVLTDADWKELEEKFVSSYFPVLQFVTENKGSFSEAREVYLSAFLYFAQSVELRGREYMEKSESLIYSFSRILWLKKLAKRNVDLDLVKHRREFLELDDVFHEIDLLNDRSAKVALKLGDIGEPCRTLMLELIGRNKPFDEVGPRLGFSDLDRAHRRIAGCAGKLIRLMDNKTIDLSDEELTAGLKYILSPEEEDKPEGKEMEFCLTMMSRVITTVRNHAISQQRTMTLRDFRDRLLPDDGEALKKFDTKPKSRGMRPIQIIALAGILAIAVSLITTFSMTGGFSFVEKEEQALEDTLAVDTIVPVEESVWLERTAFVISEDGYALTAAENLIEGMFIEVSDHSRKVGQARVVAVDTTADVALLELDSAFHSKVPFRFSKTDSKVGDELVSLGYRNGKLLFAEAQTQMKEDSFDWIGGYTLLTGAPLISSHGEITGILTRVEESGKATSANRLRSFIQGLGDVPIDLPNRNRLYYSNTSTRVEQLKPCILKVKFEV